MLASLVCAMSVLTSVPSPDLDSMRAALALLTAKESVQASVSVTRWEQRTGDKTSKQGSAGAQFFISSGAKNVTVGCNETPVSPRKSEGIDVLSSIVRGVDLPQASNWLHHAGPLLKQLEDAEVVEVQDTAWGDTPARRLSITLKAENETEGGVEAASVGKMTLWLDANHVPLASETVETSSGGVFLVVRFENTRKAERTYSKVGDRLVVREETVSISTGSMGHTYQNKQTAKITIKEKPQ